MDGTIGEIRLFAANFAPRNWAFCSGQILSIASNTALFSILGLTYGGNGITNFVLPNFQGRTARGTGFGVGLTGVSLGEQSGQPNITLLQTNLPAHTHAVSGSATLAVGVAADTDSPVGAHFAASIGGYSNSTPNTTLPLSSSGNVVASVAGGSIPYSNQKPYLGISYIICLFGIFPSRN